MNGDGEIITKSLVVSWKISTFAQQTVATMNLNLFKIRHEERLLTLVSTIVFGILNMLTVAKYYGSFSQLSDHYGKLFVRTFHISGFDPLTYTVLSNWDTAYNVYRHPLLAFFMYPLNQVNQVLMMLTGMNFATIITALLLIFCSVYSCLFLYRIVREAIGVTQKQAYLLCAFYFSFAFIMLSTMVPDHFIMSMMMLMMTLYVTTCCKLSGWKTFFLFFFTAGISLNNGLKVFLAALFARGREFFKPSFLFLAVLLPSALMWGFARWEYKTYVWPKENARHVKRMEVDRKRTDMLRTHIADSLRKTGMTITTHEDSLKLNAALKQTKQQRAMAKYKADRKKIWNRNTGKPIAKGEFSRWTDITTPRWDTVVENLFGEAIMLHDDHLLGDVLRDRPVIVRYRLYQNYLFEAVIVGMFLMGIWYGRRKQIMWTALSFFLLDMMLHVGLGFGINEIYIMSAHYLFAIPIAIAFILRYAGRRVQLTTMSLLCLTTVYCFFTNAYLIFSYMLG